MMPELGLISLLRSNVRVEVKGFLGKLYPAKMNWIELFDQTNSLYVGAFTRLDEGGGCGIYLFKIDTKTGVFTSILNLLEDEGPAKQIRDHMEF